MRAIFNIALKWNWITNNPTKEVKLLLITQKEKLAFSETELKIIINNISNVKLLNIVLFASYTGCRLSEILNVQWKDINFNEKILIIRNKENFMTKTGKIRQIPISDKFFELLNSILDQKADKIQRNRLVKLKEDDFKNIISNINANKKRLEEKSRYFIYRFCMCGCLGTYIYVVSSTIKEKC